jgi:DHA2 family multidrug resistance protein
VEKARKGKNAKGRASHAANGQPHAADRGSREEHPGKAEKARKGKNAKGRASHAAGIGRVAFFLTYRPPMATLGEHIRQSNAYKWWILGMIMLGTFMAVLDVTVVNVGLPAIMSAFGIGISTAEWVITAYMITMTVMLCSKSLQNTVQKA